MAGPSRITTVAYYALLSRLAIWAIAVASHALIQDYDSALELILPIDTVPQQLFKGLFGVFLRWDAFYFVHVAQYTESLFALCSFTGMIFVAQRRYLLAAIVFSISSTARSNGILYAGYFVYDLIIKMDLSTSIVHKLAVLVKAVILCLITVTGFVAVQAYGYSLYCSGDYTNLPIRPWCEAKPPLLYTFVQSFYWNVGFLRYYEVKQIPNFLMAAPMIILSACGIYSYIMYDTRRALSLGRDSKLDTRGRGTPPFMSQAIFPYIVLWAFLLVTNITTMHIQIITRAFSCMPPVYWFAAHQFRDQGYARSVTTFFVMYGLVGIVLFANFFPPA
ncbi:hypothetical protein BGZ94_006215 [Podila epigama]|nr:hypothetical protein BGZ94_006215 [Podila epigama]